MSRITRIVVLVTALMSLFAVMSSAAGAVTWDNSGSMSFTATGGPGTLSVGAVTLPCGSSDATGTAVTSSTTTDVATGTATFTNCLLGGASATVHCNYTLTALSQHHVTAPFVITGLADAHCVALVFGAPACTITGSTAATYTNPVGMTPGKLTLVHSSTLRVHNPPGGGTCLLGNNVAATLTSQTFTVTGGDGTGVGPFFTTTP